MKKLIIIALIIGAILPGGVHGKTQHAHVGRERHISGVATCSLNRRGIAPGGSAGDVDYTGRPGFTTNTYN